MAFGAFLSRAWNKTAEETKAAIETVGDTVCKSVETVQDVVDAGVEKAAAEAKEVEEAGERAAKAVEGLAKAAKTKIDSAAHTVGEITAGVFQGLSPAQKVIAALKIGLVLKQAPQFAMAMSADLILNAVKQAFSPDPFKEITIKCPAKRLAAIIDVEKALIKKADLVAKPDAATQKAVAAAKANIKAGVRALMSADAYNPYSAPEPSPPDIPGYTRVSPDSSGLILGLPVSLFENPEMHAVLYEATPKTIPAQYTLAFRGTDDTNDAVTDVRQALSIQTAAYENAQNLAIKLSAAVMKEPGGGTLDFTGHSLGGGEAAAASAATGLDAETFNAAGLDPSAVGYDSAALDQHVVNYYVAGEPVTVAQQTVIGIPAAAGKSVETPAPPNTYLKGLHQIPAVESSQAATNLQTMSVLQELVGPPP